MDEFRGNKLVRKFVDKTQAINICVSFDKQKHLSDSNIQRRERIRKKFIAKAKAEDEEREKLKKQQEEELDRERFDNFLGRKTNTVTKWQCIYQICLNLNFYSNLLIFSTYLCTLEESWLPLTYIRIRNWNISRLVWLPFYCFHIQPFYIYLFLLLTWRPLVEASLKPTVLCIF